MNCTGIILAGGASTRMGTPKALLLYEGETFLARLRRLMGAVCRDVLVVGPPDAPFRADVVNPHPERGMLSSLQCGLRVVPIIADAIAFTLVDLPSISEATLHTIVREWSGELLRIPRYGGRRGHPVVMSQALVEEFLAESGTPKDVIARHTPETVYVDVEDAGVVADVDTREDYDRLIGRGKEV